MAGRSKPWLMTTIARVANGPWAIGSLMLIGLVVVLIASADPVAARSTPAEIAFTARMHGNPPQIYTVLADGTGLRTLVHGFRDGTSDPVWAPNGEALVFSANERTGALEPHGDPEVRSVLYFVRADGSGLRRLSPRGVSDGEPTWSPDGHRLAVVRFRDTPRLVVMSANGSAQHEIAPCSGSADPAWSPDGRQIAFLGRSDTLILVRPDGSRRRRVHPGIYYGGSPSWPSWSPDGRRLAFAAPFGGGDTLLVKELDSGTLRKRANYPILVTSRPEWSPDGRRILFGYFDAYVDEAFVGLVPSAGGRVRRIGGAGASAPTWAPTGRALAYVDEHLGGDRSFVVLTSFLVVTDANGTGARRLTPPGMSVFGPLAWQPVPSRS